MHDGVAETAGRQMAPAAAKKSIPRIDFLNPPGAPALYAPDSLAWQVFKNPVALFVGGITAVLLELAEPRVRSGVWGHSIFPTDPITRMRRTGAAATRATRSWRPRSRRRARSSADSTRGARASAS